MTRKRYIKLLQSIGRQRNVATLLAAEVRHDGHAYRDDWEGVGRCYVPIVDAKVTHGRLTVKIKKEKEGTA